MASRENGFAARMIADTANLMTLLTGGVHMAHALGIEGITPKTVPTAYDAKGYIKPCALVRARDEVADGIVRDIDAQIVSTVQVVQIHLYEHRGYTFIDPALTRLFQLFEGYEFDDSFEVQYLNQTGTPPRAEGALKGSSLARIDFAVYSIKGE